MSIFIYQNGREVVSDTQPKYYITIIADERMLRFPIYNIIQVKHNKEASCLSKPIIRHATSGHFIYLILALYQVSYAYSSKLPYTRFVLVYNTN